MSIMSSFEFVSTDDLKTYQDDGVVCLRGVLSPLEIDALRNDVDAQTANLHKTHTAYDFEAIAKQAWDKSTQIEVGDADRFEMDVLQFILDEDEDARPIREKIDNNEAGMFFYDAAGWRTYEGIRQAALDSALPSVCTKLLNTTYLNFWEDTTFVKTPNTAQRTSFHQDYAYFQIEGEKCCIVWIALDPVNIKNGAMEYVRGSHKWGKTYAPNVLIAQSPNPMSPYEKTPDIEANPNDYDIISFDVEPGDVIIHHVMTIHGSRGNVSSSRSRRAISFRYCGDDVRYFDKPGAIVQPHLQDKLNDGDPLFSRDYPVVWPRPFPEALLSDLFAAIERA